MSIDKPVFHAGKARLVWPKIYDLRTSGRGQYVELLT
jgi:hypothetical protein